MSLTQLTAGNATPREAITALSRILSAMLAISAGAAVAHAQPRPADASTDKGRPVVVFVHGRNQMYKDAVELDSVWFRSVRNGLQRAGLAGLLTAADYRMVRYAKVFEPGYQISSVCRNTGPGAKGPAIMRRYADGRDSILDALGTHERTEGRRPESTTDGPPVFRPQQFPPAATAGRPDQRAAARADAAIAELARQRDEELATLDEAERYRASVFDRIVIAMRDGLQKILPTPLAIRFLKDTRTYLAIGPETCETDQILASALDELSAAGRPVVVVAHSMGAMVTYRVMANRPATDRFTLGGFVSIGSQLGLADVPPYLIGGLAQQPYRWPEHTAEWTNIKGVVDPLGYAIKGEFGNSNGTPWVRQKDIETGGVAVAHDAARYLSHTVVASQIATLWCRAFRAPASLPPACRGVVAADNR